MDTAALAGQLRENLAMAYRLLAHLNMDDATYTHLSARLPGSDSFYILPFGQFFCEVTASSLIEVDFTGQVLQGEEYQYNRTGYVIHGNIYRARPEINAVFHLHITAGVAVSALKAGLLPISQFALHLYQRIAYYDYQSLELSFDKGCDLVKTLGQKRVMMLRNHGTLTCGNTLHETFFYSYHLEQACRVQCQLNHVKTADLVIPSAAMCQQANHDLLNFEEDLGRRDWLAWQRLVSRLYPDYRG
ncbi:MAG: hypothetical protein GY821_15350 [Gammaproteobacteria bacterium]|nr:hypothetical protein [Gammaproteobacteria bacterium]